MYRKIIAVSVFALLGNIPLCAQNLSTEQIADQVLRSAANVVRQTVEKTPYALYEEQVAAIEKAPGTDPSYGELRPALKSLCAYNKFFEVAEDEDDLAKVAGILNTPVTVGWNNYREVPLKEMLDRYLPQENQDEDIAQLEYYVRLHLLTPVQKENIELFEDLGNKEVVKFNKTYKKFITAMEKLPSYNTPVIAREFVKVVNAYNQLYQTLPDAARLAKVSVFVRPIKAGWGRAIAVSELYRDLTESKFLGGGDGIVYHNTEWLQKIHDLSASDVELLLQFAKDYHRK